MAEDKGQLIGPGFIAEWRRFKRYVSGMMKANIPGGKNTPDGPVFGDMRGGGPQHVAPPASPDIWFRYGAAASRDGAYLCTSVKLGNTSASPVSHSGTTVEGDLVTLGSDQDLICFNVREFGLTGHQLAGTAGRLPFVFYGTLTGDISAGGLRVVLFDGYQWKECP